MRDLLRRPHPGVGFQGVLPSGVYAAGADRPPAGPAYAVAFGVKTILSVLFVIVAAECFLPRASRACAAAPTGCGSASAGNGRNLLSAYLRQLRLAA